MNWILWMIGVLVCSGIIIWFLVSILSVSYADKCRLLTPDNYTFVSNQLGICTYESDTNIPYDKCVQDIVDTENHGTVVGSSTCNKKLFTLG